jgi:Restriction endonuclease
MTVPAPIEQPPAIFTLPIGDPAKWSQTLDTTELKRHVAWCRNRGSSTRETGDRLEALACWLISHLAGFSAEHKNVFSEDGAQEIDIIFWNEQLANGFVSFGSKVIVECKNWARRVDSSDIAWFAWKMRLGGVTDGILIAANGITMNKSRREDAVAILAMTNSDEPSRRIYVLTLEDIEGVSSTDDLRKLLIRKSMNLTARTPFE